VKACGAILMFLIGWCVAESIQAFMILHTPRFGWSLAVVSLFLVLARLALGKEEK